MGNPSPNDGYNHMGINFDGMNSQNGIALD
jgi:hypothetical protein